MESISHQPTARAGGGGGVGIAVGKVLMEVGGTAPSAAALMGPSPAQAKNVARLSLPWCQNLVKVR